MSINPLKANDLYHACNRDELTFSTTAELEDLTDTLGQNRALEAIDFGVGIRHDGYNLFVLGSTGIGKHFIVTKELEKRAVKSPIPSDWCYVNNFNEHHKPKALKLPAGMGKTLRDDMTQLVDDLQNAIPASFRSDEYRTRMQEINEEFDERQQSAFDKLNEDAKKRGIAILRTPTGYTLAPMRDDETISPEDFDSLPKAEQERIETAIRELRDELKETIRRIPGWQKEYRQRVKLLNQEVSELTVDQLTNPLLEKYKIQENVVNYVKEVKDDVVKNVEEFRTAEEEESATILGVKPKKTKSPEYSPYSVNVLVDNSETKGAPVVYENNPTYLNLVGRIEHLSQFGTLSTDFTLIKPGALHKANGGYLVLDAHKVLMRGFAWEGLKRALSSHEIRIESLEQMLSLVSTITLEPEPIPINVKLILTGDRLLYYLLNEYDHEFGRLFKVAADFSEDIERSPGNTMLYARLIASLQRREKIRDFDAGGVARVIEQCARRAEDGKKISLHMGNLVDLLHESDYWAEQDNSKIVMAHHVQRAIDKQIYRRDQIRSRIQESIQRGIRMIDSDGEQVAQVNGLSVMQLGDYSFGSPSRITATARLGEGEVIDIEREVELGGPIHSKAVMILSAYLADHYARNCPLSLSATVVFEQSYGMIEGDSASIAELCALLSAISGVPVRQSLAVTGSINQLGQVQAIGGVNEKIEGFFDVCDARGLTGSQGVIIPKANVNHLMLRYDVVDAAQKGKFHIYPVETVEQALELLTGLQSGEPDAEGNYPEDSLNGIVQQRLEELNSLRQEFAAKAKGEHLLETT
ncbi:MAG: AAA family ATPase [Gammaproteobacteria bacterium]|nr:AAA family ATPase [Gammaproteobacteria bacterium]